VGLVISALSDLPSSPVIVWAMAVLGMLVLLAQRNGSANGNVRANANTNARG
jgi:ABC-type Mn2+/Zn2+ transport system permease subunit